MTTTARKATRDLELRTAGTVTCMRNSDYKRDRRSELRSIPAVDCAGHLPDDVCVVYLCSRLGQVCGEGLFAAVRRHYPRWMLYSLLVGVLIVRAGL